MCQEREDNMLELPDLTAGSRVGSEGDLGGITRVAGSLGEVGPAPCYPASPPSWGASFFTEDPLSYDWAPNITGLLKQVAAGLDGSAIQNISHFPDILSYFSPGVEDVGNCIILKCPLGL